MKDLLYLRAGLLAWAWHLALRLYRPNRSDRLGSRMLGKVKRGRGWRWGWGTGGPGTGGRPPVGPVKKGAPGPENPGLRGTLGGGGGG